MGFDSQNIIQTFRRTPNRIHGQGNQDFYIGRARRDARARWPDVDRRRSMSAAVLVRK
jgi:hypothetical protein